MNEHDFNRDSIHPFHYLTYGRNKKFLVGLFLQTVPILFALVPGSVPIYRYPVGDGLATTIFSSTALLLLFFIYNTTKWLSQGTYSVDLRKTKSRVLSTLGYILVGVFASVIGYLLFIEPSGHPEFGIVDVTLGIVYALIYAQVLALVLWKSIDSETTSGEISENIRKFRMDIDELKESSGQTQEEVRKDIVKTARDLAEQFKKEPASGTRDLGDRLADWADSFEDESSIQGWMENIEGDKFSAISHDLYNMR